MAVFGHKSVQLLPSGYRDRFDTQGRKHAVQLYLRNRTTAHREYLMGSTVNNLSEFWVCKLSYLKRHQSIQKAKYWNTAHLSRYKRNTPSVGYTPAHWSIRYSRCYYLDFSLIPWSHTYEVYAPISFLYMKYRPISLHFTAFSAQYKVLFYTIFLNKRSSHNFKNIPFL
jgi:hypothetical protein